MKTNHLMSLSLGILFVGMSSCKKEQPEPRPAITQTIEISLKAGEHYSLSLAKNKRDDEYRITTPAVHASTSLVSETTGGSPSYEYTAAEGFNGTDLVVVSNDWERDEHTNHQGPPPSGCSGQGNCQGGEEDHYIYTLHFTIENATSRNTVK